MILKNKLQNDLEIIHNSPIIDDLFKGKKLTISECLRLYKFMKSCLPSHESRKMMKQALFEKCQKIGLLISKKSIKILLLPIYCLRYDGTYYKYICSQNSPFDNIKRKIENIKQNKQKYYVVQYGKQKETFTEVSDVDQEHLVSQYYDYITCICYVINVFSLKDINDKSFLKELCYSINNSINLAKILRSTYGNKLESVEERTISSITSDKNEQSFMDCINSRNGNFYFYFHEKDCTIIFVQQIFLGHPNVKSLDSKWEEILNIILNLPLI